MTIRLKRHHLNHPAGSVVSTYGDGVCATLIARGVAVEVKAIKSPPKNKAMKAWAVSNKGAE